MLAVLAIKLDLMHAERHVKVSEDFVQLCKWIWLQDLAEIYIQCLYSQNVIKGANKSGRFKNIPEKMNYYTNLCYKTFITY